MTNIVTQIIFENRGREQRIALTEGSTRITYTELFCAVERDKQLLEAQGIRRHDRVALFCEDSIDYVVISLAILSIGAALAPVSPSLSTHELDAVLNRIDAGWLLYDESRMPACKPTTTPPGARATEDATAHAVAAGSVLRPLSTGASLCILPRDARNDLDPAYPRCNPAFVRFSSGTTGTSKGVVLSHEAIMERTDAANKSLRIDSNDRVVWVLSMSFHFVVTILLFLRRGAEIMLCGRNFPQELHRQLARGSFLYASPFHYDLMASSPDFTADRFANIRMAVSTAMPLSSDVAERFEQQCGIPLCQAYGIIEVGLPFIQTPDALRKPGSVGTLGPDYEIRLDNRGDDGAGEVLLRGKGMFTAYFSPWRMRRELDPEGWFHTGDLGRMDEDGYLFLVGRTHAVINYAGMKVFPVDVEAVLNRHPSVRESRVYGKDDPGYGQLPVADVVPTDEPLNEKQLRRFCYASLAPYQVPKEFRVVDTIQKTASGKVKR